MSGVFTLMTNIIRNMLHFANGSTWIPLNATQWSFKWFSYNLVLVPHWLRGGQGQYIIVVQTKEAQ